MVGKKAAVSNKGFSLAENYDINELQELLTRASILNNTISDIPMLPQQAAEMDTDIAVLSISGTASLEGNAFSEDDIRSMIITNKGKNYSANQKAEISNLIKAYNELDSTETDGSPLMVTEDFIKSLHSTLTDGIDINGSTPGEYRNRLVKVGSEELGGVYRPPVKGIDTHMAQFIEWINSEEMLSVSPYIRAALAHYQLSMIHPFFVGNGRTARLLEAHILHSANVKHVAKMLSNHYYRHIDTYFKTFTSGRKGKKDITAFIKFVLEAVNASLDELKNRVYGYLYDLTMREYLCILKEDGDLNQRQHDLVLLMMDENRGITLATLHTDKPFSYLYGKVTEQTARRDLKKLTDMRILTTKDNKTYEIGTDILCF